MHLRCEYSNKERLVCARTDRTYDNLLSLKLCNKKLKRVSKVKFLGVIIDEKLKVGGSYWSSATETKN